MSYRIRPTTSPRQSADVRLVVIGVAAVLVLVGVVGVRIATGADRPDPLAPITLTITATAPASATTLAISPDGHIVAAASGDQVLLWDTDAMAVVGQLEGSAFGRVAAVAFVDEGRGLVVGASRSYGLFDVATRTGLWSSGVGVGDFGSFDVYVAAAPNSPQFQAVYPAWMEVHEWTSNAGAEERAANPYGRSRTISTLTDGEVPIPVDVAVSPDGTLLAEATTSGAVLLFQTESGNFLGQLPGQLGLRSVAFSGDGRTLATAAGDSYDQVILWDVATRSEIRTLRGAQFSSNSAEFGPDGRVVAVGGDHELVLWDAATGAVLVAAPAPELITSLAFHPTGRRLVTAGQALVQWDLSS